MRLRKKPANLIGGYNNNKTATHSNKTMHQAVRLAQLPISGDLPRTILKASIFRNLLMAV